MISDFSFREATTEDLDAVFSLHTEQETRKTAFKILTPDYAAFSKCYIDYLNSDNVKMFVVTKGCQTVGAVEILIKGENAQIYNLICAEQRLSGLDNLMLNFSVSTVKEKYPGIKYLSVKSQKENIAYRVLLSSFGFEDKGSHFEADINSVRTCDSLNKENGTILFLTNNENAVGLFEWVKQRNSVILYSDYIFEDQIKLLNPSLIISYNYNFIITEDVINAVSGNIINMHISLLPWNRGFSPNLWSFLDDTPKGVTIHKINPGLDKGELIYQKEMFFDPEKETLATTYNKLNDAIVDLFKEHYNEIVTGNYNVYTQVGAGSYHSSKDLSRLMEQMPFNWSDTVSSVIKRYKDL